MRIKLLLFALVIISVISLSSCATTDPRAQYYPVYRTYQNGYNAGYSYRYASPGSNGQVAENGYDRKGKHHHDGYFLGLTH